MNEVVHTSPTIGSNVEEVVWKNIHFIMWDLGGQESLRAAWNTYYTNSEVGTIDYDRGFTFPTSLSLRLVSNAVFLFSLSYWSWIPPTETV